MTVHPAEPVVVSFHGELTIKEAPQLRDSLLAAIRAGGQLVVVDFSDVSFVDQSAMGVLIGARARLVRGGGDLRLAGLQPKVARVVGLVGGNLPVYPTVAAAVADPLAP
ncbi:MAG: anti-sigma factor antagonist [Actinomycetota bacterium]|nr:anti-sigma factor antagonist [Actinomycetota bacterium]